MLDGGRETSVDGRSAGCVGDTDGHDDTDIIAGTCEGLECEWLSCRRQKLQCIGTIEFHCRTDGGVVDVLGEERKPENDDIALCDALLESGRSSCSS